MENALKIKVFRKSILFCKYLLNGSLDLYEILCSGQLLILGVGGDQKGPLERRLEEYGELLGLCFGAWG